MVAINKPEQITFVRILCSEGGLGKRNFKLIAKGFRLLIHESYLHKMFKDCISNDSIPDNVI